MATSEELFFAKYDISRDKEFPPGGFGKVLECYKKDDPSLKLVVKIVNYQAAKRFLQRGDPSKVDSPMKEFRRELELLNIFHSNELFCQAVEWFWNGEGDDLRIVMKQYATDLFSVLMEAPKAALHLPEAQVLFGRVASALQAMHAQNLVHRDLKLENVFLDSADDFGTAVLADFGCARRLQPEDDPTKKIGTMAFWPPEMMEGSGHYTNALDVWQLGCFMFTCACRFYPFGEEARVGMIKLRRSILAGEYPEDEIPEAKYPGLSDLIRSCLIVDPTARITIEQVLGHPFFT
eukprot:TRINITY_DN11237_c0_g1_i9.p1 TRINITY_DN11237_c0_g1~~TRINITY_DN11237_c0_g1_i9.p1  ORF type:complete len:292 (+),score=87.32 TRINITY_DN11237_c0_g1_i9:550-1425(+)